MRRIHFLFLTCITYLWEIVFLLISRSSVYPYGGNILTSFSPAYWILLSLNATLLTIIITKWNTNRGKVIVLAGIAYAFLFYITNLHFIIPYKQSDNPEAMIEYLLSAGSISHKALSMPTLSYLSYPISFIFEVSLMLIGNIGRVSIYTVGLFVFLFIFYIGLIFYYSKIKSNDLRLVSLSLAIYSVLSFYVINAQLVPQMLALAFLPFLYGLTFDFTNGAQRIKVLSVILVFWFALVFTHPFMFLFYLLPVVGVIAYNKLLDKKTIQPYTIGIMMSVWGLGFIYSFYHLLSMPIKAFTESLGHTEGETWWIFGNFFRKAGSLGPIRYVPHPHYELIPKWIVSLSTWGTRLVVVLLLSLVIYVFVVTIKRAIVSKTSSYNLIFDISVILSSGVLFVVGLFSDFLGQRSFQVTFMSLSRFNFNLRKILGCILTGILIIAPILFTVNVMVNSTVTAPLFIRDTQTTLGGEFLQNVVPITTKIYVFTGTDSIFPSGLNITRYDANTWIRGGRFPSMSNFNYVFWSKKVKLTCEYYGINGLIYTELKKRNRIYDNAFLRIYNGRTKQ